MSCHSSNGNRIEQVTIVIEQAIECFFVLRDFETDVDQRDASRALIFLDPKISYLARIFWIASQLENCLVDRSAAHISFELQLCDDFLKRKILMSVCF